MKLVHPNIVKIYEFGEQEKSHLHDHGVCRRVEPPRLPQDPRKARAAEALPLMIGLAKGLKYSLEQGVTHRDIKATNILIASKGEAKLVDFGLATIDERLKAAAARRADRRLLGPGRPAAAPRGTSGPTSSSSAASSTRCSPASSPCPRSRPTTRSRRCSSEESRRSSRSPSNGTLPTRNFAEIIEKMMKVDLKGVIRRWTR